MGTVAPGEISGVEQAVLLVLMAESRAVANPELALLGPTLDKSQRDNLVRRGLIEVTPGRPLRLELAEPGWELCKRLIGSDAPAGVTGRHRAIYTVLKGLRRYFDGADLVPADVFVPPPDAAAATVAVAGDTERRVRDAYAALARRDGGWIALAELRDRLRDVDRPDLDATLRRMYELPGVSLVPEDNQKALTDADRAAAVEIGGQRKHVMAIQP